MNLPQIFMYQGSQVRTVIKDGEPWLVAKDVCEVLGIKNHSDAISRLNNSMKSVLGVSDPHGRVQDTLVISEPGMYKLVFRSNKSEAEEFGDWVATEVLPSIRKTGSYGVNQLPQNYKEALIALIEQVEVSEKLQMKIELDAPKVALYDVAMSADGTQPVGTVAKELGLGRTRLFALLREKKILRQNNEPYQEYIERGYFRLRMYTITHNTSGLENKTQTMVTPKGISWLHKIINDNKGA